MGAFCDSYDDLSARNAIVIGISPGSVDRVRRFGNAIGANVGLGSDSAGEVRRLYDVQRRFGLGTSCVTYVIDGEGVISGVFHNEIDMGSHVRSALSTLQEFS